MNLCRMLVLNVVVLYAVTDTKSEAGRKALGTGGRRSPVTLSRLRAGGLEDVRFLPAIMLDAHATAISIASAAQLVVVVVHHQYGTCRGKVRPTCSIHALCNAN
jgi:hypothetical protein